jgi:MATE family multidrug resistance protein
MDVVRPVMFTLVTANVVNAVGNWAFVYGHAGLPAMGVIGSAYATAAARLYMAVTLLLVILWKERRRPSGLRDVPIAIDTDRVVRLVRLGLPAAVQLVLEVGVFATACALAARLTPIALAANQIVMNVASFFFMIPLGLSSAAAVRVGQAVGRFDSYGARRAGWTALGISFVYALVMSALFVGTPRLFLSIFTSDELLLKTGMAVLFIYAFCQPFDGAQNVATGALRGLGETRAPMIINLIGHWPIGLPIAYVLCFQRAWGVYGLWAGLSVGLCLIAVSLVFVWNKRSSELSQAMGSGSRGYFRCT